MTISAVSPMLSRQSEIRLMTLVLTGYEHLWACWGAEIGTSLKITEDKLLIK